MKYKLTKRHKIVISTAIMTLLFILTTPTANIIFKRYYLILLMGILSYGFSIWSLWEGMTRLKAVVLMILPTLFCLGFTSFYFTLDQQYRDIIRVPAILGF